jgi:hypothetical protein
MECVPKNNVPGRFYIAGKFKKSVEKKINLPDMN